METAQTNLLLTHKQSTLLTVIYIIRQKSRKIYSPTCPGIM